jgi:hypothetical protein
LANFEKKKNMTIESSISNLKNFVFIAVPLSIAMTYIGVISFYFNYNIDISTYLGFEDLTIIYSKYTIASLIYLLAIYITIKKIFKEKEQIGYWDKTIFKTNIKRKIIPFIIAIGLIIYFMIINETLRVFFSIILISLLFINFIEFSANNLFFTFNTPSNKNEKNKNLIGMISFLFIAILMIPFSVGFHSRKIIERESVIIHLDNNKIIDAQTISNLKFIGKTSSFVFIQDSINMKTMVFPMDKIMEIEYCNSK